MQLKLSGKGNDAPANGVSGDLLVLIEEKAHDYFVREGSHLHFDLYVSISEAVLGVSKELNLLEGKARIKLENGIQSGKTLRLRGKGLPSLNSYGNGDLLVHINVWTPKTLNKEQRLFLKKCREILILLHIQKKLINLSLRKLKICSHKQFVFKKNDIFESILVILLVFIFLFHSNFFPSSI